MINFFGSFSWAPNAGGKKVDWSDLVAKTAGEASQMLELGDFARIKVECVGENGGVAKNGDRVLAYLQTPVRDEFSLAKASQKSRFDEVQICNDVGSNFLLCVVDGQKKTVNVYVDAFSTFPIFYCRTNDALLVSTDLERLISATKAVRRVNRQAIYDYFVYSVIPAPATIYENVFRLPAGSALTVCENKTSRWRWYRPGSSAAMSDKDYAAELRSSLSSTVSHGSAISDSGFFLSGGLDSSTICGVASQNSQSAPSAFSIGFRDEVYDEIPYARMAAEAFGLKHNVHYVDAEEVVDCIDVTLSAFGEPFSNASAIVSYICGKQVLRAGFESVVAGDGGDELFAGNERYLKQVQLERFMILPLWIRKMLRGLNLHQVPANIGLVRKLGSYINQASLPMARRIQFNNFIELTGYKNVFSPNFLETVDPDGPINYLQTLFDEAPFDHLVKKMLYVDWQITLADNDLRKVRKACDLAGVDVRFPMLDPGVFKLSEALPGNRMMPGRRLRGFFKDTFRSLLPEEIIDKPKHGFGVPVGKWLLSDNSLLDLVNSRLESLAERDIFSHSFIEDVRNAHHSADAVHYGVVIWTMFVLEAWLGSSGAEL